MALLSDDLFLVQRQADNKLFKLQLDALIAEVGGDDNYSSTHVGQNPPANPSQGDLWYQTEEGILFVYYIDDDSSQWVDTNPSGFGTDENNIAAVNQVLTQNTYNNDALEISPNVGIVNIEIKNASQSASGVVRFADATDLSNSTVGVAVDAAQLMDLAVELNNLSNTVNEISPGIQSISEGGTNIVDSALQISTLSADETALGINEGVFTPFDFSALTNVTD